MRFSRIFCILSVVFLLGSLCKDIPSAAAHPEYYLSTDDQISAAPLSVSPDAIDWLEPRGLSIVDLVGQVPDAYLAGSILSYTPGYGILRYESGQRNGDTVVITAQVYPRHVVDGGWSGTMFGCLGQPARIDQPGTVVPASTVRIYSGGTDVTRQVGGYTYVPAGLNKPIRNPAESQWLNEYRYWESGVLSAQFTADGALKLPANMGCEILMSFKDYRQLKAVFTLYAPSRISVEVVGGQTFTFHSYIGPGYAGLLAPLANQLSSRFGSRADTFALKIPSEADYLWLNFPPMPVDPYTQFPGNPTGNVDRVSGGSYRTETTIGLSVDVVTSMGLPIYGHWRDMDLSGDAVYLPYTEYANGLAAPEYFVPPGVSYDPCMIQGTCSSALLDRIYNTSAEMRVVYLKVERTSVGLYRVPLRMVGPAWDVAVSASLGEDDPLDAPAMAETIQSEYSHFIYLPVVLNRFAIIPPDDPTGCPCGWLTEDGRMVDFIP